MEHIERTRCGGSLTFSIALQAEVRRGTADLSVATEAVTATFAVSDWLAALEQCGFGTSLLFEVPLPVSHGETTPWTRLLLGARDQLLKGHYAQAVGDCRLVLEALNDALGQGDQLHDAKARHKVDRQTLTVDQRELILRQTVMDYASSAHHTDQGIPVDLYDRRSAQMILAMTVALVSSAVSRSAEAARTSNS